MAKESFLNREIINSINCQVTGRLEETGVSSWGECSKRWQRRRKGFSDFLFSDVEERQTALPGNGGVETTPAPLSHLLVLLSQTLTM